MDTIVLCHGFPGFDRIGPVNYFAGVKKHLEATCKDIRVLTPEVSAFGSIKTRAENLADILRRDTRGEKLHLIAHSAGGLDARKMVSDGLLRQSATVVTVSTISTPHAGTRLAEIALRERLTFFELLKLLRKFKDLFQRVAVASQDTQLQSIKDFIEHRFLPLLFSPRDFEQLLIDVVRKLFFNALVEGESGLRDLTRDSMKDFNAKTLDSPEVKYFYYAGVSTLEKLSPEFYISWPFVSALEDEDNDGWISLSSASARGSTQRIPADHLQQIGHGVSGFDHLTFYKEVVEKAIGKPCTS
jgi:hypothetical protein